MKKLSPKEARDIIMVMFETLFYGGLTGEETADAIKDVIVENCKTESRSCELHQTLERQRKS